MSRRFPADFEERNGVWRPRDTAALTAYSDGDAAEEGLRAILAGARDLASDSPELRAAIRDWPTRYHLAPERANLLRVLDLPRDARVLELGCGCGAVTRYLGERVAEVVAVEGSLRRAELARLRCRDLDNVQVVAGNFADLDFEGTFDVVTLIGVLEYAALYGPAGDGGTDGGVDIDGEGRGVDPWDAILRRARRAVAPGGTLLVAIENALGVKYLAGCGEDHGLPRYAGVEGYPDAAGPRTFGREELARRLRAAGFESARCLLPFPDYKLPTVVIDGDRATAEESVALNLADWCRQPFEQYDGEREFAFSDHLALAQLAANGRLADAANSFLFLARAGGGTEAAALEPDWIARKLNVHRRPRYRTELTLRREADGTPVLLKTSASAAAGDVGSPAGALEHLPEARAEYLERAPSLALRMLQALRQERAAEAFALCLGAWLEYVRAASPDGLASGTLDGIHLDCTPDNLLLAGEDGLVYVDAEWRWPEPVPVDWILYRGLRSFWHAHHVWVRRALGARDADALFRRGLKALGLTVPRGRLAELRRLEAALQAEVNDVPAGPAAAEAETRPIAADLAAARDLAGDDAIVLGPGALEIPAGARAIVAREAGDETRAALAAAGLEPCPGVDVSRVAPRAELWRRAGQLRITLLAPSAELHGGTLVIFRHAERLAARGHRVVVAAPDPEPPDWTALPEGVTYLSVPREPDRVAGALPRADALVATLWTTAPVVRRAPADRGEKLYLVQAYEPAWAGEPDDVEETYRLPLAKLCVSSWLQELLEETYGEASALVPNGCDFAGTVTELPPSRERSPLRVGMLYHESPVKGTSDGLTAFAAVQAHLGDRVRLALYGTRRPRGLGDGIEFLEAPSRARLASWLDALDVFVSPSRSEGFGLPALEAMCRGVAVVTTDSGGNRDYAVEGAALVSPPGDPEALAANLLRACRDAGLRRSLAERGLAVSAAFDWDRAADAFESAIAARLDAPREPLRIVHVGAGPVWFDTFLDPWLVRAFRALGHEVHEFHPRPPDFRYARRFVRPELLDAPRRRAWERGEGRAPRELPGFVADVRPDLVFLNHGLLMPPDVLDRLRRDGVPTAAWMMDEPQEVFYSANRGRLFDAVFLQDAGSLALHRRIGNAETFLLPHGADPVDHRLPDPGEQADPADASDVLLIGTGFPGRRRWLESLRDLDCDVRIVGRHWEGLDLPNARIRNAPVDPQEAGRLYRGAKITLNLHRGKDDWATGRDVPEPASPNGSFFHIAACGSLQMVDRGYPGAAAHLVPGRQYVEFDDGDDLAEKIERYLERDDERRRIAADAAWTVHRHQTYAHRLDEALRTLGRPRSRRRIFGLSAGARRDAEPFDAGGAVPLVSVVLHVGADVAATQRALLGAAAGQADPNEILVVHPPAPELERWLDARDIAYVACAPDTPAAALEAGRARTDGEILVYVSERALVTTHLYRRLAAALEADRGIALLGPAIHPAGGAQAIEAGYASLGELGAHTRERWLACRGAFEPLDAVDPLCFAVRRDALEQAGGLDARFPAGTLELADLAARLRAAGRRVGWTASCLVHRLAPPSVPDDAARGAAVALLGAKGQAVDDGIPTPGPAEASDARRPGAARRAPAPGTR